MRDSPSTHALGRAVADLRQRRHWTQVDLSRVTGLHRAYIAGVERGARNPTWETLGTLARGLHVPLSDLVARAEALDDDAQGVR